MCVPSPDKRGNRTSRYQDQYVRITGETLLPLVCPHKNADTDHGKWNSDLYRRMNGDWISAPAKRESVSLSIACVYEERHERDPRAGHQVPFQLHSSAPKMVARKEA
jgi:hypothetical protein